MKFRVWNKKERCYDNKIIMGQQGELFHRDMIEGTHRVDSSDYIVQMCSMTQDWKDKLIFDGDIVVVKTQIDDGKPRDINTLLLNAAVAEVIYVSEYEDRYHIPEHGFFVIAEGMAPIRLQSKNPFMVIGNNCEDPEYLDSANPYELKYK